MQSFQRTLYIFICVSVNRLKFELSKTLGFVYRSAAVDGFGKPGKSAAAAAITLTTQGEMCTTKTKKPFGNNS